VRPSEPQALTHAETESGPLLQPTILDSRPSHISADIAAHVGEARAADGGDFARGQRLLAGRAYVYGDFATGMRSLSTPRVTGDFATGMRTTRRQTIAGDFATGMRTITTPVAIDHVPSAERALPLAA
jgi:hypothetical protein